MIGSTLFNQGEFPLIAGKFIQRIRYHSIHENEIDTSRVMIQGSRVKTLIRN